MGILSDFFVETVVSKELLPLVLTVVKGIVCWYFPIAWKKKIAQTIVGFDFFLNKEIELPKYHRLLFCSQFYDVFIGIPLDCLPAVLEDCSTGIYTKAGTVRGKSQSCAGSSQTFPRPARGDASMRWTWTYSDLSGERLLDHCTAVAHKPTKNAYNTTICLNDISFCMKCER